MTRIKIGAQIKRIKEDNGTEALKATVPMNLIFERDFDAKQLNKELRELEAKYIKLVDILKIISKLIKVRQLKGKVILYWMFGDEIYKFTKEKKNSNLFLESPAAHLVRDTGVSEKMLSRCKKFRLNYPSVDRIELHRSFDSYVKTFEQGYISAKKRTKETKHA
jgi:replication-associated recombination protein RarA